MLDSVKQRLAALGNRLSELKLPSLKPGRDEAGSTDDEASPAAPTRAGASKLRGPWRKASSAPAAAVESAPESVAPVVIEPVEVVDAGELVKPTLWVAVLTVAVVLSAVAVILGAYDYRQLFHQHQRLIQQRDDLQVEWGQLLLEQSAWAASNRVEVQAMRRLDMTVPEPQQIEIVRRDNRTD